MEIPAMKVVILYQPRLVFFLFDSLILFVIYWLSVNEIPIAKMQEGLITVCFRCVKLAFHVSKCSIVAHHWLLVAGLGVPKWKSIVACAFLGKNNNTNSP